MYPVTGYASQNDYELHFGLGSSTRIDSLKLEWPSGHIQVHKDPKINTHFTAIENGTLEIKP